MPRTLDLQSDWQEVEAEALSLQTNFLKQVLLKECFQKNPQSSSKYIFLHQPHAAFAKSLVASIFNFFWIIIGFIFTCYEKALFWFFFLEDVSRL